jgi:hypothetical protein
VLSTIKVPVLVSTKKEDIMKKIAELGNVVLT